VAGPRANPVARPGRGGLSQHIGLSITLPTVSTCPLKRPWNTKVRILMADVTAVAESGAAIQPAQAGAQQRAGHRLWTLL